MISLVIFWLAMIYNLILRKTLGVPMQCTLCNKSLNILNSRRSAVCISSLDASKAFDRVNHSILFEKLIEHCFTLFLIKVLVIGIVSLLPLYVGVVFSVQSL